MSHDIMLSLRVENSQRTSKKKRATYYLLRLTGTHDILLDPSQNGISFQPILGEREQLVGS